MISGDIIEYQALENGRCSNEEIPSGAVAKLIKHVPTSLRKSGGTRYYCSHTKITNADNGALLDPKAFQDKNTTSADDYVVQCLLPVRTAKADIGSVIEAADLVGSAVLAADVLATASTLVVTVKHADMLPGEKHDIFRDAASILITSNTNTVTEDGDEVERTISGTPSGNSSTLEVTITTTEAIGIAFAAGARVTSLLHPGDVKPSFDSVSLDSGNTGTGSLNTGVYPPIMSNAGTREMDWTMEWTDNAGNYTVTGDAISGSWSGNVSATLTIANPDNGAVMLELEAGMFEGDFADGDKAYLTTHEATVYRGQAHVIASDAEGISGNSTDLSIIGDAEPVS